MADGTTRGRRALPAFPVSSALPAPRLLTCRRHIDLLRVSSAV